MDSDKVGRFLRHSVLNISAVAPNVSLTTKSFPWQDPLQLPDICLIWSQFTDFSDSCQISWNSQIFQTIGHVAHGQWQGRIATGVYRDIYSPPQKKNQSTLNFLCGCFVSLTQDNIDIVQFIPTQIKFLATPLHIIMQCEVLWLCWVSEQGLTSRSTQYRSFRRRSSRQSLAPARKTKITKSIKTTE